MAAAILVRRFSTRVLKTREQLGFTRNHDLLWFQLLGQGTPRGYYALAFASWLSLLLTGFRFPYAALAIGGMFMTVAWGVDQTRYPSEQTDKP